MFKLIIGVLNPNGTFITLFHLRLDIPSSTTAFSPDY